MKNYFSKSILILSFASLLLSIIQCKSLESAKNTTTELNAESEELLYAKSASELVESQQNIYLIAIGINEYEAVNLTNLKFASKDARDFEHVFKTRYKNLGKLSSNILTTSFETEKHNILRVFSALKNLSEREVIQEEDRVVIFYSGHSKVVNDRLYLLPSDYNFPTENMELYDSNSRAIDFKTEIMQRYLGVLNVAQISIFLDVSRGEAFCQSFEKSGNELNQNIDIFLASSELAWENQKQGNGLFTAAILEAFENEKVEVNGELLSIDKDNDHQLTYAEMSDFLKKRVPFLANEMNRKQMPITISGYNVLDELNDNIVFSIK